MDKFGRRLVEHLIKKNLDVIGRMTRAEVRQQFFVPEENEYEPESEIEKKNRKRRIDVIHNLTLDEVKEIVKNITPGNSDLRARFLNHLSPEQIPVIPDGQLVDVIKHMLNSHSEDEDFCAKVVESMTEQQFSTFFHRM